MQKKKEILERANNKPNYSITHDMTNIYTEAFPFSLKSVHSPLAAAMPWFH